MHQVREVLRLNLGLGLTLRQTARPLGLSRSVATDVVTRARAAGLSWPLHVDLADGEIEHLLYPAERRGRPPRPGPDFAAIRAELQKHKNLLLAVVWTTARIRALCTCSRNRYGKGNWQARSESRRWRCVGSVRG